MKFGEILFICYRNEIVAQIKVHNSGTNVRKMMCNNPNVDLVNMKAYTCIKLSEIL